MHELWNESFCLLAKTIHPVLAATLTPHIHRGWPQTQSKFINFSGILSRCKRYSLLCHYDRRSSSFPLLLCSMIIRGGLVDRTGGFVSLEVVLRYRIVNWPSLESPESRCVFALDFECSMVNISCSLVGIDEYPLILLEPETWSFPWSSRVW